MTDLDCAAAAAELINRGRDEALAMAALRSTLAANQAVAAALTALADRTADKPRRRNRTLRLTHDSDGEPVVEDVTDQPEPTDGNSAEAPSIEGQAPAMTFLRPELRRPQTTYSPKCQPFTGT
jgi:hypothetical protein